MVREYGRKDSFTDAEVYNTEYSGEDINLADYVVRLNGEDGHMEFTEDEVIKTINKTQDAMTDDELKRFERIEYEALDTETLRDASTAVDMVAEFNLDYRIKPKEEGLIKQELGLQNVRQDKGLVIKDKKSENK